MTQGREQSFNILLVDDDEGDAFIIEDLMTELELNIQLHHVGDGIEAMAYLRRQTPYQQAARPDLILLDLNMPKMDGRQVLKAIRSDQRLSYIPVVILTTSDAGFDINNSYLGGGNCYLIKPTGIQNLLDLLSTMGHFWGNVAELPSKYLDAAGEYLEPPEENKAV